MRENFPSFGPSKFTNTSGKLCLSLETRGCDVLCWWIPCDFTCFITLLSLPSSWHSFTNKLFRIISEKFLWRLYNIVIYPHLTYALEIWGKYIKTDFSRFRRLLGLRLKILWKVSKDVNKLLSQAVQSKVDHEYFVLNRI